MGKRNDPSFEDFPDVPPTEPPSPPKAAVLGTLPDPIPAPADAPTIEEHAAELGTHPATLAAVKAYFRLGEGRKLSREHYELLVAHVENLKFQ